MLDGNSKLIAHIGYPTASFKAPLIYNPYFDKIGLNAVVVPMGVKPEDYPAAFASILKFTNMHGALITMPHKVTTVGLVDEVSITAQIAGAANAVLVRPDGTLLADMFDGEGFVRGLLRKNCVVRGAAALVVGSGGVGCAIAASLAAAGAAKLGLFDMNPASAEALAARLAMHYPTLELCQGSKNPAGYDIVVNATPLGMTPGDPLPLDVDRVAPGAFVGEVVMKQEYTPFLNAALVRGCRVQVGTDMLFEMIPAYLEFFGFPTTTPEELRAVAKISY